LKRALAGLAFIFAAQALPAGKEQACLACHGASGASATPLTPSLGGQPAFYVIAQLFLFREGRRESEAMVAAAKGLSDQDLRSLAESIAKLAPPAPPAGAADPARLRRGQALVAQRHCASCHGAGFEGHQNVPRVANQREDYLLKSLRDYRSGKRVGYGNAVMPETVAGLDDDALADLAHFLSHMRR
jgi:cytochrome c553